MPVWIHDLVVIVHHAWICMESTEGFSFAVMSNGPKTSSCEMGRVASWGRKPELFLPLIFPGGKRKPSLNLENEKQESHGEKLFERCCLWGDRETCLWRPFRQKAYIPRLCPHLGGVWWKDIPSPPSRVHNGAGGSDYTMVPALQRKRGRSLRRIKEACLYSCTKEELTLLCVTVRS